MQPSRGRGEKWRISDDGGAQPLWARDGRELFYHGGNAIMSVKLGASSSLSPDRPRALFRKTSMTRLSLLGALGGARLWDIAPDGRFLMIEDLPSAAATRPVTVVLNWLQELQNRSSAR